MEHLGSHPGTSVGLTCGLTYMTMLGLVQQAKYNTNPAGKLQTLTVPSGTWEDISLDPAQGSQTQRLHTCERIVVIRLSKMAHFYARTFMMDQVLLLCLLIESGPCMGFPNSL